MLNRYKDSDSTLVSIVDDDDWESESLTRSNSAPELTSARSLLSIGAMDQARESAQGRSEGKLEIIVGDG